MKKILLILMVLLFAFPVYGVDKKVLAIIDGGITGAGETTREVAGMFQKVHKAGGITYNIVLSSDTATVWALANSGNYSGAVALGLPISTDKITYTEAGLDDAGWPALDQWINRNSGRAFPIPLFLPLPVRIRSFGQFTVDITGMIKDSNVLSTSHQPIVNAAGDSILAIGHFNSDSNFPVIATNDSLDWVYPLAWIDSTITGYDHAVYSMFWMTKGSGNHKVIYLHRASTSYNAGFFCAAMGMITDFQPLELPLGFENFAGDAALTVANVTELIDSAIVWGAKLDFITNTYDWINTHRDTDLETKIAANRDNVKMTIYGVDNWPEGGGTWTSYSTDYTQDSMEVLISAGLDSINNYPGLVACIDTTTYLGYLSKYNYAGDNIDIYQALTKYGLNNIYIYGGGKEQIAPADPYIDRVQAAKTVIKYNATTDYDIYFYSWGARELESWMDNGVLQPSDASIASYPAAVIKYIIGGYANNNSMSGNDAAIREATLHGHFQPGFLINAVYINSDNNALQLLTMLNEQKDMINYIVNTYGNGMSEDIIKYSWMEDVKWDRRLGRKWPNSHIKRN